MLHKRGYRFCASRTCFINRSERVRGLTFGPMRCVMRRIAAGFVLAFALMVGPVASVAQDVGVVQSPIVLLDPERLFEQTKLGKSLAAAVEAERLELIALNRKLEGELESEEKALTEKRANTTPEEFRDLADAFDAKVQQIRRDSERRARDLERNRERAPRDFLRQVEPILVALMRETGAVAVLDRRSVLLSADVVNITELAIQRIDRAFDVPVPEPPEANPTAEDQ